MLKIVDLDANQFEIYTNALTSGYSELVSMYLAKNDVKDINKYLYPTLKDLESPLLMKDAKKGMDYFINNYQDFCLVGDYDTDGVTASAIVYLFMKEKFGYEIPVYIPERKEGYGLSKQSIDYALKIGKKAIITVDNGIAAFDAVDYAKANGLFVLVTDHHEVQARGLPNADLLVNPKRSDSLYSDKELSGAAVIWNCLRIVDHELALKFIPLVLLGTIADVVPLKNQNRIIAKHGTNIPLQEIEIKSIYNLLVYLKKDRLERELIEYKISPMINSAGRMENAMEAFNFFIAEDDATIQHYIEKLEETNALRKETQALLEPQINALVDEDVKFNLIFPPEGIEFPSSLVGIMAGKLVEETNKPTIVFYRKMIDGVEYFGGSGRTLPYFNFKPFIERLKEKDILKAGGGHKAAIGLTFPSSKMSQFLEVVEEFTKDLVVKEPILEVYKMFTLFEDKETNEEQLQLILEELELLEPFGNSNEYPNLSFKYKNATNFQLLKEIHLKFQVYGINVISFFNKFKVKNQGTLLAIPQKNIWYTKAGVQVVSYQLLLKNYIID